MVSFSVQQTKQQDSTKLAALYASYRIALAIILATLFAANFHNPLIGSDEPIIFALVTLAYFFIAILNYVFLRVHPNKENIQSFFGLIVDIVAFTLMLYANGGPNLQMTLLYLVTVVAAFIIVTQKQAIVVTLFAIICVVYQQFFYSFTNNVSIRGFSSITLLSLSFMGAAFLSSVMTSRMRNIEQVAEVKTTQVEKLHQLNQSIIENMDSGVAIVDKQQNIQLINKSAQRILGLKFARIERNMIEIDESLFNAIKEQLNLKATKFIFNPTAISHISEALSISFHRNDDEQIIIFIDKVSKSKQQAQQLKLASLGRLTASIAHEIRNPIGAISQASQLLQEEENDLNTPLYKIIHKQTQRVNQIIEDVMQLSRQQDFVMDKIYLDDYIPSFVAEHFENSPINVQVTPKLYIEFSQNQLEQVLVNLVGNGLFHGKSSDRKPQVTIVASFSDNHVNIDVIDNGDGISHDNQQNLFEPFFTTAKTGTGLGLYLSRAFCEANGGSLTYIPNHQGACFRISKANF